MTSVALPIAPGRGYWRAAQVLGVLFTLALVVGLWLTPARALHVLWDMVIPLLPAVFLVNPMLWRNVCPLATLNEFTGNRPGRRSLENGAARAGWALGIVLLFVLVPARRFLFNENGPALAAVIAVVGALALLTGMRFARRAGFCNSICPVLPVEKLYGQDPLRVVHGVRCDHCSRCAPVGCFDLTTAKSVAQTVGPKRRDVRWLGTAFGAFAAAFPGFVVGYFTTKNGDLSIAASTYRHVLGLAALSYLIVAAAVALLRLRAAITIPLLGATALALYYWYATPTLVAAYGIPAAIVPLRILVGALLVSWLWTLRAKGRLPVLAT